MKSDRIVGFALRASRLVALLVFWGVVAILVFGYGLAREWQRGVAARIARQNEESADLILKAITRDMRGAQTRVLANRDWDAPLPNGSALDMTEQVATTFARYPYPESFFTWRGGNYSMIFFNRTTRPPKWMPSQSAVIRSPIVMAIDPPIAGQVRQQVLSAGAAQLRYAVFDTQLAGVPYQIVARITYSDLLREHLESVSGFTVNLDWVRNSYFNDILSQVGPSARGGLTEDIALLDEHGRTVFGSNDDRSPTAERSFPLLFMDSSDSGSDVPSALTDVRWMLRVSASRDPILLWAQRRLDITFLATSLAVILCGASLMLMHKAVLSGVKLTEMRSRFVSSVTHELKTPLANIHALSATLARQPPIAAERYREYPKLLIQETTNLSRLVDNLLAYARITDVAETYAFEAITAAELVDDALKTFRPRLSESGINIQFDMSPDLPCVHADQRAMMLALNNLIDNAIRHVRSDGHISISTKCANSVVSIEVQDDGCGISAPKLTALKTSIASREFSPSDGGGLGLAITSKVVADHGGTFTVESALGMGTRCVIGLPAY